MKSVIKKSGRINCSWGCCNMRRIGTPRQNVEAFIYAVRKYGRGERKGKLSKGILEEEKIREK